MGRKAICNKCGEKILGRAAFVKCKKYCKDCFYSARKRSNCAGMPVFKRWERFVKRAKI